MTIVGAVIVLTAASEGAQEGVSERIQGLGSNLMFVRPGAPDAESSGPALPGTGPGLFYEDGEAIGDLGLEYVDGIAAHDGVLGARRSPLEEIRTNIRAAGLIGVERNGRFERTLGDGARG